MATRKPATKVTAPKPKPKASGKESALVEAAKHTLARLQWTSRCEDLQGVLSKALEPYVGD